MNKTHISIEINKSALLNNFKVLQSLTPCWQLAPVIKANAYGHGIDLVAKVFSLENSIPFFCVDSYFEAERVRKFGITKPILILGYTNTKQICDNELSAISFVVGSLEQLKSLIELQARQTIHIKFDTGMHRQGIVYDAITGGVFTSVAAEILRSSLSKTLRIDGIMSHFADADSRDSQFTQQQITRWNELAAYFQREFPAIRYYHISNSAGLAYHSEIMGNTARPGIALYGIDPGNNISTNLEPVLRMKTIITDIRSIDAAERVGYNGTFVAARKSRIATVPVGYFEGIDRRLSNKGIVLVAGVQAPICGRVSMNMTSCDVTDLDNVKTGTSVTMISNRSQDNNSVSNIAKLCDTIPYEILVHLPAHLERVLVEGFE